MEISLLPDQYSSIPFRYLMYASTIQCELWPFGGSLLPVVLYWKLGTKISQEVHRGSVTSYGDRDHGHYSLNIGSGNGSVPSGNKPLPEAMLTYHRWDPVTITRGHFHKTYLSNLLLLLARIFLIWNFIQISPGPMNW